MKFVLGGVAGIALGFVIMRTLGAKGSNTTPAPCNNGACMVPALIAVPIMGLIFGGVGGGLGAAVGEGAFVLYGLGQALKGL